MHDYLYWIGAFVLSWAALSTYWDWLFGYDNFYAHGMGLGLAILPLAGLGVAWWAIVARSLVLSLAMGIWSEYAETDYIEEMGRGAFIILTLPLLLLA